MFSATQKSFIVRFSIVLILLLGMLGVQPAQPAAAATFTVTNSHDSGAGSLRQAIVSAASGDTITFNSSLSGQTITLASTLVVDKNLTIDGSSLASKLSISGNHAVRVFQVTATSAVTFNSLMIVNGFTSTLQGGGVQNLGTLTVTNCVFSGNRAMDGGGIVNRGTLNIVASTFSNNMTEPNGSGGGIFSGALNGTTLNISNSIFSGNSAKIGGAINNNIHGTTTVTNTTFTGNSSEFGGGAIENIPESSTVIIVNSTFSSNSSTYSGGGIDNVGILTVTDSMFVNNSAGSVSVTGSGGGISNFGDLATATIKGTTFSNNSAGQGGGIDNNSGSLTLTNSTFSGNSTSHDGAGLNNSGTAQIRNSTFSGNSAGFYPGGSGISNSGTLRYYNTILANSISWNDCVNYGTVLTNSNNLVETNAASPYDCGTPSLTADPKLGPLANNGGPTQTMALASDSVAVDAGNDATCELKDQRGVNRPFGSHCDIGAYEFTQTFSDMPYTHPFYRYIEAFYKAGITTGCSQSPKKYCPDNLVTRAEMAVFIERAKGNFSPTPNPTGMFADMPYLTFTPFIEQLYNDGITTGCALNPLRYCPSSNVTRAAMAAFIERAIGHFNPTPNPTGMFADVPAPGFEALTPFIEQFYNDGITTGCASNPLRYCPANNVTRGEMAVFIVRAFHIPLP